MTIADLYKSIAEVYTKVPDPLTCEVKLSVNNGIITECNAASAYVDDKGNFCIDSDVALAEKETRWVPVNEFNNGEFYKIKVVIYGYAPFSLLEVDRISACIGYALKQHIRGEELSTPEVITNSNDNGCLVIQYFYDSTKTASDDPDFVACFDAATEYINCGTPIRKTNRTGAKGTRLCEGVKTVELVNFYLK